MANERSSGTAFFSSKDEKSVLAGAHDYLMRVIYRDSADFERIHTDILTQLPGVTRVQSTLTLRTIKKSSALPV